MIVQSLWIKGNLSSFENTCINSFLKNGYAFHLYTYDKDIDVPHGTTKLDASQIIPEEEVFEISFRKDTGSAFSNIFRYKLLFERGGIWVDTDVVCLNKITVPRQPIGFGYQSNRTINGAVLISKPKEKFFQSLLIEAKK